MTTTPVPRADAPHGTPLDTALARLVDRGVLDAHQAAAVRDEVGPLVGPAFRTLTAEGAEGTLRRRLSEVAAYVGAAFVVGAAFLFLGERWDQLSPDGRVGVLGGIAVLLAVAGAAVVVTAPAGLPALRDGRDEVRRRLSSTLFTGAAAALAFAVGLFLDERFLAEEHVVLWAGVAGGAAAVLGYAAVRSALGQLALAAAAAVVATSIAITVQDESTVLGSGIALVAVGLVWAGALMAGLLRERLLASALAGGLALLGAQIPYGDEASRGASYLLTVAVTAACFVGYTRSRSWPLLAVGVLGATLVVPEAVGDLTDGALGASGVMLVAGLSLLGASIAGLRLRKEVTSGPER